MLEFLRSSFSKRKFHHFLYTHIIFFLGILILNISWIEFLYSVVFFLTVVSPFIAIIAHLKFNHNYIEFRSGLLEWAGLLFMTTYSFWKFENLKSYHILHHTKWNTNDDPTWREIQQGKLIYYIGLVHPTAIPLIPTKENNKIQFVNQHFYPLKLFIYGLIALLFGIKVLFLFVLSQQFYYYVSSKSHEMLFHSSKQARDLPLLFPIFFNNAFHVEHHREYNKLDPWHWPAFNLQYWYYKLFFK